MREAVKIYPDKKTSPEPWCFRIVGRPEEGRPFFVVRENSRNNSAYGPFTERSFPLPSRKYGKSIPAEHLPRVLDIIQAFRELARHARAAGALAAERKKARQRERQSDA